MPPLCRNAIRGFHSRDALSLIVVGIPGNANWGVPPFDLRRELAPCGVPPFDLRGELAPCGGRHRPPPGLRRPAGGGRAVSPGDPGLLQTDRGLRKRGL